MHEYRTVRGEWRRINGGLIWARPLPPRFFVMAELYRSGETLAAIGAAHGLTRERVRQILAKGGIDRSCGGASIKSLLRVRDQESAKVRRNEKLERRALTKWGMTLAQYREHVALHGTTSNRRSPMARYISQRRNASKRGIAWEFTFADWWRIWQESGHWHERGRGTGYCMARYGDSGPYGPKNVYICTIGQNFSDSYLVDHPRRKRSTHLTAGVSIDHYKVRDGVHWRVRRPGAPARCGFSTRHDAIAYLRQREQEAA